MMQETQVLRDSLILWGKNFCPQNWENGPKGVCFEFIEKFGH